VIFDSDLKNVTCEMKMELESATATLNKGKPGWRVHVSMISFMVRSAGILEAAFACK
jgi:hypothetical protein